MSHNNALLDRMIDEAAIRNATSRFADAAIRADYEGFATLWSGGAE